MGTPSGSLFKQWRDQAEDRLQLLFTELPHPWATNGRWDPLFFKNIPSQPGVYRFFDANDQLLYVGKAKSLKARLLSYRRARPDSVSRKVIHLIRLTTRIEWEVLPSEAQALLVENQLLRTLKPPFNVQNTRPESYGYVWLHWESGTQRLSLRYDARAESRQAGELVFGPFKSRSAASDAMLALARLLWIVGGVGRDAGRFEIPQGLVRSRRGAVARLKWESSARVGAFDPQWLRLIKSYLRGQSSRIIVHLTQNLLLMEELPPFVYRIVQEDLDALRDFYEWGPKRTGKVRKAWQKAGRVLKPGQAMPQDWLDDGRVLVLFGES